MIRLAYLAFFRSNSARLGLIFIVLAGIVSLAVGKQFLQKSRKNVDEVRVHQQAHIDRMTKYNGDDIGLLLYYAKFSLVNKAPAIMGLSIGQRDINSSIQSVTIRGLEAQKYDAELNNPYNLHIGNIDYSFVLVYLFPLLIIVFTYNILSEQQESGTWKIVSVQNRSPLKFILQLFGTRISVVCAACLLLLMLAVPILNIPVNALFLAICIASLFYNLFWFAISFLVVSFQKSSNFNAVVLLSTWILLLIIVPAVANNYLVNQYPVPEALATTIKQRKAYHEKWDIEKGVTMEKFYAHYPQYRKYPLPDKNFSWLWYYAMQQMGDDESRPEAGSMKQKLSQREDAAGLISRFIPTMHAQHQLNNIAQSGLCNHIQFLDSTTRFHEKLRLHFYPKIFENHPVRAVDWKEYDVEYFSMNNKIDWVMICMPFVLFTTILFALGWLRIKYSV